MTRYMH